MKNLFPLTVVVNGQPTTIQAHVGMDLRQVARVALAQVGSIGRPLEDWYFRDDYGAEINMDYSIIKPFDSKKKLWLCLDVVFVSTGKLVA